MKEKSHRCLSFLVSIFKKHYTLTYRKILMWPEREVPLQFTVHNSSHHLGTLFKAKIRVERLPFWIICCDVSIDDFENFQSNTKTGGKNGRAGFNYYFWIIKKKVEREKKICIWWFFSKVFFQFLWLNQIFCKFIQNRSPILTEFLARIMNSNVSKKNSIRKKKQQTFFSIS